VIAGIIRQAFMKNIFFEKSAFLCWLFLFCTKRNSRICAVIQKNIFSAKKVIICMENSAYKVREENDFVEWQQVSFEKWERCLPSAKGGFPE